MVKAFESFWIATRLLLLVIALTLRCTETWAGSDNYIDISDLKDYRGSVYCSEGLAQNLPVKGRSHRWTPEFLKKVQDEKDQNKQLGYIKEEYCSGSTPRHAVTEKIRMIVPKVPAGIALDIASDLTKNYIKAGRAKVKNIFFDLASGLENEAEVNASCSDKDLHYFTLLSMTGPASKATGGQSEDIENRYKNEMLDVDSLSGGKQPMMFVAPTVGSNSPIYLLPNRIMRFAVVSKLDEMTGKVYRSFDEDSMSHSSTAEGRGFYVVPQTIGIKKGKINGIKVVEKFPVLRRASLMEGYLMKSYFVLMMPKEAQKEIFAPQSSQPQRFFGLDDSGEIKPSKLLEDRGEQWRAYFEKFTSIKEAPSSDPTVIDFEAELNMAVFCQYAKPTTQFVSR